MTREANRLLKEALQLSDLERAELARELLASLDGPADPDAEQLWAEEIRRRLRAFEENPTEGVPWEEALLEIRKGLWGKKQGS